jgi:hypothetical protein
MLSLTHCFSDLNVFVIDKAVNATSDLDKLSLCHTRPGFWLFDLCAMFSILTYVCWSFSELIYIINPINILFT